MPRKKKSKTIYAVSQGVYSDYRVLALFSTLELAERYRKLLDDDDSDIEEYTLDENAEHIRAGLMIYSVTMAKGGEAYAYVCPEYQEEVPLAIVEYAFVRADLFSRYSLRGWVWATGPDHAKKIANDRRAFLIANGEWPDEEKE